MIVSLKKNKTLKNLHGLPGSTNKTRRLSAVKSHLRLCAGNRNSQVEPLVKAFRGGWLVVFGVFSTQNAPNRSDEKRSQKTHPAKILIVGCGASGGWSSMR